LERKKSKEMKVFVITDRIDGYPQRVCRVKSIKEMAEQIMMDNIDAQDWEYIPQGHSAETKYFGQILIYDEVHKVIDEYDVQEFEVFEG